MSSGIVFFISCFLFSEKKKECTGHHWTIFLKAAKKWLRMRYADALRYLETLQKENEQREEWSLEPVKALLEKLDNPQKRLGIVFHISGTNGKGSTSAMLANILHTAGYKTALYTSPHLSEMTERIKINNEEIEREVFAFYVHRLRPFITTESFFEVLTALAFLYFAEQDVDFSVIEVGMGGRLDATNVVHSTVSIITNISLEHTQRLGKTEQQIAFEKAGIIKENSICVTAAHGDALHVIEQCCKEKNTLLMHSKPTDAYELSLQGAMQKENAGIVVAAIEALKKKEIIIPKIHIVQGLKTTYWPGRMEFIEKNVLVDVAHNPGGMQQLAHELQKLKKEMYNKVIFVVGILADKDWKIMLDSIVPLADAIILTKPNNVRAADPGTLHRFLEKEYGIEATVIENIPAALEQAKRIATSDDLIVVTGSFYTVGEIYRKKSV